MSAAPAKTRSRKPKQANPQGRLDWLTCRLLERVVDQKASPFMKALHAEFKGDLENLAKAYLGPRSQATKAMKRGINIAKKAMEAQPR